MDIQQWQKNRRASFKGVLANLGALAIFRFCPGRQLDKAEQFVRAFSEHLKKVHDPPIQVIGRFQFDRGFLEQHRERTCKGFEIHFMGREMLDDLGRKREFAAVIPQGGARYLPHHLAHPLSCAA